MQKKRPNILLHSFKLWQADKVPMMSAALSYYTVFSMAPLLLVLVGLIGLFVEPADVQRALRSQTTGMLGSGASNTLIQVMKASNKPDQGFISVVIGGITLLFSASGIFGQMKESLNLIWKVKPKPHQGIVAFIRERFLSFSMLVILGFILLVSFLLSAILTRLSGYLSQVLPFPPLILQGIDIAISLIAVTLLFGLILRILPDAEVPWRQIWPSAFVTAVLFTGGKYALGLYIRYAHIGSSYGAAGSLIVILLWVYYITQILFYGAELSKALVLRRYGHITAKKHAQTYQSDEDIFHKVLEKKMTKVFQKGMQRITSKQQKSV